MGKKILLDESVFIGFLIGLLIFVFMGLVTVLIPNNIFIRMTPIYFYDYVFLILTSVLSGAYATLWHYSKKTSHNRSCLTASGVVAGFFSFGCAICNKLLILIIGLAGVTTYFMPIQPLIGAIGIMILSYAVYRQYRNL